MWKELTEAWRYRAVVENFTWTSLGVRYRRSVLGYLWTVLSPLLRYATMGVVFEIIGRFAMHNYYGFMFLGSVYFGFVSTVVSNATTAFIRNEHYIKKIYVPKLIFIFNIVISEIVNFALVLVAVVILLLAMGQIQVGFSWLFVPVSVAITIISVVGLASLAAVATIYFRDLQHIIDIAFQALFFATPIFYPLVALANSPVFHTLVSLNPLLYYINIFRDPLVNNVLPDVLSIVISLGTSILFFFAGVFTISKFNNRIIFKL